MIDSHVATVVATLGLPDTGFGPQENVWDQHILEIMAIALLLPILFMRVKHLLLPK